MWDQGVRFHPCTLHPLAQELHFSLGLAVGSCLNYVACMHCLALHLANPDLAFLTCLPGLTLDLPGVCRVVWPSMDFSLNLATATGPALLFLLK